VHGAQGIVQPPAAIFVHLASERKAKGDYTRFVIGT
jgi:hypothetical protein